MKFFLQMLWDETTNFSFLTVYRDRFLKKKEKASTSKDIYKTLTSKFYEIIQNVYGW